MSTGLSELIGGLYEALASRAPTDHQIQALELAHRILSIEQRSRRKGHAQRKRSFLIARVPNNLRQDVLVEIDLLEHPHPPASCTPLILSLLES